MEIGASVGETPAAVVKKCKYTIAMLSDPSAALSVGFYFMLLSSLLLPTVNKAINIIISLLPFFLRWFLTQMGFLSKLSVEKVTLTCLLLTSILLQRSVR